MADEVICPVCEEDCKEDEPEFCSKCQKPAHCWCVVKIGETQLCVLCYERSKMEVEEGEMPHESYTLINGDAKLSPSQKENLINWASAIRDSIKAHYPADSLQRPKKK
jgi:hypothetical protein